MEYCLRLSKLFVEQFEKLSNCSKKVLMQKLEFLKINPYHYKKMEFPGLTLFRVRFSDMNNDKRMIYCVKKPFVEILFIVDRRSGYKDLRRYLKRLGYY